MKIEIEFAITEWVLSMKKEISEGVDAQTFDIAKTLLVKELQHILCSLCNAYFSKVFTKENCNTTTIRECSLSSARPVTPMTSEILLYPDELDFAAHRVT